MSNWIPPFIQPRPSVIGVSSPVEQQWPIPANTIAGNDITSGYVGGNFIPLSGSPAVNGKIYTAPGMAMHMANKIGYLDGRIEFWDDYVQTGAVDLATLFYTQGSWVSTSINPYKPDGSSTGPWATSYFTWDNNYDFYLYVSDVTGSQPNCGSDPNILYEYDSSVEVDGTTYELRDYRHNRNRTYYGDPKYGNKIDTGGDWLNRYIVFNRCYGPLIQGTAGQQIKVRISGSGCSAVGITTNMWIYRVARGYSTVTLSCAGSASVDSSDTGDCATPAEYKEQLSPDSDSITVESDDQCLYFISDSSESGNYTCYAGQCGDTTFGGESIPTLSRTGNTITLALQVGARAARAKAECNGSVQAKVLVWSNIGEVTRPVSGSVPFQLAITSGYGIVSGYNPESGSLASGTPMPYSGTVPLSGYIATRIRYSLMQTVSGNIDWDGAIASGYLRRYT